MVEAVPSFTEEEVQQMLDNLDAFSDEEVVEINRIVDELEVRKTNEAAYDDLIEFCKRMQPDYIVGKHHRILANMLMDIEEGNKDRICVNIRATASLSLSLSSFQRGFGAESEQKGDDGVAHHRSGGGFWSKSAISSLQTTIRPYFPLYGSPATGNQPVGGTRTPVVSIMRAVLALHWLVVVPDLLLVDDPHSEQDVINGNFTVFEKAYEWFTFGARTRLMPGGRVAIIQTRWHQDDLTGRVVRDMTQNDRADEYEVVEFPAILEIEDEETEEVVEKPLWPEFFD